MKKKLTMNRKEFLAKKVVKEKQHRLERWFPHYAARNKKYFMSKRDVVKQKHKNGVIDDYGSLFFTWCVCFANKLKWWEEELCPPAIGENISLFPQDAWAKT